MSPAVDPDERLARIMDGLSRGESDVDTACRKHPDLADEIRQLAAVGQMVGFLARSESSETTLAQQPSPGLVRSSGEFPREFGDFVLMDELGRGGMGVVYKAWDPRLNRHVALKMILRGKLASEADQERFRREAQAAAGLNHPNIVPVFQVGEVDGQAYFSMPYVPGRTLSQRIGEGPLPQREAARLAMILAQAVHQAHVAGILHRDLKPANVLLAEDGQPTITDFGLAKDVAVDSSLTGSGGIVGTPSYMAPEQAGLDRGRPIGPGADIYSLGAILYEMLTGRPPFLAATAVETLLLVRGEEPVLPRLLNPQIDLDLELICRKCLEKRPEHRYSSAAELARDLNAFLTGDPPAARSSSLVYFLGRLFRETHHAPVLEHWGLLWIWHSVQVMVLCGVTSLIAWAGVESHIPFLALWTVGLVVWGAIFWRLRKLGGPVTFVERQIAHAWAAGVVASIGIFVVEVILQRPVLELFPVLAVIAGMIFLVKAGTLSGWFYLAASAGFLTAIPMAWIGPPWSPVLFGIVSALGFLIPGVKYYRQRLEGERSP